MIVWQTLVSINVYLTRTAYPLPPALHRWAPAQARIQTNLPRRWGEPRCCPAGQTMQVVGLGEGRRSIPVSYHHIWGPSLRPGSRWQGAQAKPPLRRSPPRAPGLRSCPLASRAAQGPQPSTPTSPALPSSAAAAIANKPGSAPRKTEVPPRSHARSRTGRNHQQARPFRAGMLDWVYRGRTLATGTRLSWLWD